MNQIRMGGPRIAGVVFCAAAMVLGGSALAETEASARKHAGKANQLAAKNKCKAAIFEFTRALKTLKDPGLLFNRAECFRKVGRTDEAVADYEEFLVEMPQAPNRTAVEAHIAALKGSSGRRSDAPSNAAAAASPAGKDTAPGAEAATSTRSAAPPPPAPAAKPADSASTQPAPTSAPAGAAGARSVAAPPPAPPKPEDKPTPAPARKAEKWAD